MDLRFAVIHSLVKDVKTTEIKEVLIKEELLDNGNASVVSLVEGVSSLLGTEKGQVCFGQFRDDGRQGRFPASFDEFCDGGMESDEGFMALTKIAMDELCTNAANESWATGGNLLFALYTHRGSLRLLVAMLKQRDGITLENLIPKGINHVDFSKIHQAACIDVSAYLRAQPDDEDEDEGEDLAYLRFVSGKATDPAGYFIEAIGCQRGVASSRATKRVIKATEKFFHSKDDLKEVAVQMRDKLISYLSERCESGEPACLDEVYALAVQCVPVDKVGVLENFITYLNDENNVPSTFAVSKKEVGAYKRIRGGTRSWKIQFDKGVLGVSNDSDICYDVERKTLTFSGLPSSLIDAVEKEIEGMSGE